MLELQGIIERRCASKETSGRGVTSTIGRSDPKHPLYQRGHVMAEVQSSVTYRDIPGFPGYRVGNDGSAWSCWKRAGLGGGRGSRSFMDPENWHQLSTSNLREGYPTVALRQNRKAKRCCLHRILALTFFGPCPDGCEVAHENGIRTDSRLENLSYKTRSENQLDRARHGTDDRGEKNKSAKTDTDTVLAIRAGYESGDRVAELARRFGLQPSHVSLIVHRKAWKHV